MLNDSKRRRVGDQPATTLSFKDDDSLEDSVGENDEEEDNFDYFTIQEEPRRKTPKGPTSKLLNSAKSTDPSVKSDGHLTEEQNVKIAAEYKQILSLCGDGTNKFNPNKIWKYKFIPVMDQLFLDNPISSPIRSNSLPSTPLDERARRIASAAEPFEINFQKASITIDVSTQLYAHRVDNAYDESFRVLESLSKSVSSTNAHKDNENQRRVGFNLGNEGIFTSSKPNKFGTYSRSSTIESTKDNINTSALDNEIQTFDPMFQKVTKLFDEGGTKGMLLYNMRLAPNTSCLSFGCKQLEDRWNGEVQSKRPQIPEKAKTLPPEEREALIMTQRSMVNMADLMARSRITLPSIQSLTVSSKLSKYRQFLGRPSTDIGIDPTPQDHSYDHEHDDNYDMGAPEYTHSTPPESPLSYMTPAPVPTVPVHLSAHTTPATNVTSGDEILNTKFTNCGEGSSSTSGGFTINDDDGGQMYDESGAWDNNGGYGPQDEDEKLVKDTDSVPITPPRGSNSVLQLEGTVRPKKLPKQDTPGTLSSEEEVESDKDENDGDEEKEEFKGKRLFAEPSQPGMRIAAINALANIPLYGRGYLPPARPSRNKLRNKPNRNKPKVDNTAFEEDDHHDSGNEDHVTPWSPTKKGKDDIRFTLELVDPALFETSSNPAKDKTLRPKSEIERCKATSSQLLMKPDAPQFKGGVTRVSKPVRIHDLARLFLLPSVLVTPKDTKSAGLIQESVAVTAKDASIAVLRSPSTGKGEKVDALISMIQLTDGFAGCGLGVGSRGGEQVWLRDENGKTKLPAVTKSAKIRATKPLEKEITRGNEGETSLPNSPLTPIDYHGVQGGIDVPDSYSVSAYDDVIYNDGDGDGMMDYGEHDYGGDGDTDGLHVDTTKLLVPGRIVNKETIKYAKSATRVDVHRLKRDVWDGIQDYLGEVDDDEDSPAPYEKLSFQELKRTTIQQQKEASTAYYFICLLHLANENGLILEGKPEMNDITIRYGKQGMN